MNSSAFFDEERDKMVRRGDWTRAAELNLLPPEEWQRPFRVLVTRLSSYEDTSLSITHHYLYALIASLGYYPDRAFLPPARDEALWEAHGIPWLTGVQSRRSGDEFGLIAISNAVVQEMGNLLLFLARSGFPVQARARAAREDLPLVILGGANAPHSALFWGEDSPVDGVFVGDSSRGIEAVFRAVAEGRAAGDTKGRILESLARIPGFLIPGTDALVTVRPERETLDPELLAAMPVALGEGNAGKAVLAISAGCAGFCAFCAESWTRKPYTEAPAQALAQAALAVKAGQGASRLDVFSFNFNMHAELYPFLEAAAPWFSALGLKSQRFDSLAADPLLIDLEKLFGKTWFTCGLEGISDRLRRALNKNLDAAQLSRAFAVIARSGVRELKVFLIATGWEEEVDYEELSRLLSSLKSLPGPQGRPLRAVFSVTPLVRFPHTPLEFDPAPDAKEVDKAARRIVRTAKDQGFDARLAAEAEEAAACDLMVRPPTPEVSGAWADTVLHDGFVYRDEIPAWFVRHWHERLDALGWSADRRRGAYGIEANRSAPWSRVEVGVKRGFLEAQYGRNRGFRELVPADLVRQTPASQALVRRWTEEWKARAKSQRTMEFAVTLTERSVAAGRDQAAAALARALMLDDEVLARGYRGFVGTWWGGPAGGAYCAVGGDDRLELVFLPEAADWLDRWSADDHRWEAVNQRFAPFGSVRALVTPPSPPQRWTLEARCPWPIDGQRLLTSRGLKHTLRRLAPGHWSFEFPAASAKKDWILALESSEDGDGWIHRFTPGSKWDWRLFLEEGFAYPEGGGASRVTLTATEGSPRLH
jgi:radical SAM superfamily enzyme YgiQ (UPF0313 family)